MWSCPSLTPALLGGLRIRHQVTPHNHLHKQPVKPADDTVAMEGKGAALWRFQRLRENLRQRLSLQIDVGTRISHRRVEACVTEPLADGGKVDACLSRWIAVVWRRRCGWIRLPANVGAAVVPAATSSFRRYRTPNLVIAAPRSLRKIDWSAGLSTPACCFWIRSFNGCAVRGQMGQMRILLPLPARRTWKGNLGGHRVHAG